jgi:hypothetical protein
MKAEYAVLASRRARYAAWDSAVPGERAEGRTGGLYHAAPRFLFHTMRNL